MRVLVRNVEYYQGHVVKLMIPSCPQGLRGTSFCARSFNLGKSCVLQINKRPGNKTNGVPSLLSKKKFEKEGKMGAKTNVHSEKPIV